jgi:hypothetical protein
MPLHSCIIDSWLNFTHIIYNFLLQLHRRLSEHDIFFTKSENQVSTIEIQYYAI